MKFPDIPEEEHVPKPNAGSFPRSGQEVPPRSGNQVNPGRRLHAFEAAARSAPPARIPWRYRLRLNRELAHRAYWDVATTFSLIFNAILIGVLLIVAGKIRNLKTSLNGLLGGFYGSLEKMDQVSIDTTIKLNTQIPLDLNLPLSQNTETVLTRDINIPNAHLVLSSGILKINAQANVTIPAGTILPVTLNLNIPVHTTIPVSLQVPVSIPISQTGLHEPINALQTSLRPLSCMLDKNAQYPTGIFICADHDVPTPGIP